MNWNEAIRHCFEVVGEQQERADSVEHETEEALNDSAEEQHIQSIVDKLISDKRDRTAHSYDDYQDNDERSIHLTVAEIRFLYNHFTGGDIDEY